MQFRDINTIKYIEYDKIVSELFSLHQDLSQKHNGRECICASCCWIRTNSIHDLTEEWWKDTYLKMTKYLKDKYGKEYSSNGRFQNDAEHGSIRYS